MYKKLKQKAKVWLKTVELKTWGKEEFTWLFLAYFALVSALRLQLNWGLPAWWLGGGISLLIQFADRLFYVYYVKPDAPLSVAVKRFIDKRQFRLAYIAFKHRGYEQEHLALQSALFMAAWVVIALYVITSSGSMLAAGLVLGLGLQLIYRMIADYREPKKLKAWLFWQIKRPVSDKEMRVVVWSFGTAFVLLTWLMV